MKQSAPPKSRRPASSRRPDDQKQAAATKASPKPSRHPRSKPASPRALLEQRTPPKPDRAISFEYFNAEAREVFLAGTFNGWDPFANPMIQLGGGRWSATVNLRPGQHEYRLIVDGAWTEDPLSDHYVANPFQGLNSVIEVLTPDI